MLRFALSIQGYPTWRVPNLKSHPIAPTMIIAEPHIEEVIQGNPHTAIDVNLELGHNEKCSYCPRLAIVQLSS